ncbi:hypothetical protein ACFCV3_05880 [Kribbella sp. NPDC056345]|uniref:hypothetical protein n=1 Tax=Kribbella sp. NPDC056345 TaxID=3345789 RepID=UPI0035D57496
MTHRQQDLSSYVGLVSRLAPRFGRPAPGPDEDLGFGGYGLTLPEYLQVLDAVLAGSGADPGSGPEAWPDTIRTLDRVTRSQA